MKLSAAIITAAVKLLADNTNLIPQPDPIEGVLAVLFGGETREQRLVRQTEEVVDKVTAAVRETNRNRKFKTRIIDVKTRKS